MSRVTDEIVDRAMDMAEEDSNEGICLACGEEAYCVEPDARYYTCEACGEDKVFGAMEIILRYS
jgi:hypothetical protein